MLSVTAHAEEIIKDYKNKFMDISNLLLLGVLVSVDAAVLIKVQRKRMELVVRLLTLLS